MEEELRTGGERTLEQRGCEKIGEVTLDDTFYSGKDYYSEGEIEDELLKVVMERSSGEYEQLIGERQSWPFLYHLSSLRENIVDWIPMSPDSKVLEVGSGCGAITGALARKAGEVTCVELSRKRSLINAYRHRDCGNVTIRLGNFKDIEPTLGLDYDFICLIGVFEYGQSYIGGDTPFEDFLGTLLPHLKPEGRIIIAIENKYGLKYFAGCKEDHLGSYFGGIENYAEGGGVRTFGRNGLERIFESCGVKEYHFYYPYPDYKFMTSLYSDARLPGKGELCDNLRNFDNDRMVLFDEKNAFDGLVEEGLFPVFSNSYLAVIGRDFPVKYVKYSNDRAPEYAVRTQIMEDGAGLCVRKYPLGPEAEAHVREMALAYDSLWEKYAGSGLKINPCQLEEGEDGVCARFAYEEGVPLTERMDALLAKGDLTGFQECFRDFVRKIGHNAEFPAADFDLIFSNILVKDDAWTLIDYEWTFGKAIPPRELAYRAIYYYFYEDEKRKRIPLDWVLEELQLTETEAEAIWEQEKEFQALIRGNRTTMAQMRDLMGGRLLAPRDWIDRYKDSRNVNRVQIYEDTGEGCSEEHSYFVRDAYKGDGLIEFQISFRENVKILRIDPALDSCMVKILEMTLNGERVPLERRKVLLVNGRIAKPADKEAEIYQPSLVFPTEDPNINLNLEGIGLKSENILKVRMEIVRIPASIAQDMAASVKKLI